MKIQVTAMSKSQSRMHDSIANASEQINLHIAKLMLFPESPYVDHWMHEIWSFMPRIGTLKSTGKLPKSEFIKKVMSEDNDILSAYLVNAADDEDQLDPVNVSVTAYTAVLTAYQDWLSKELSANGLVRQQDVKDKLAELLFEQRL